MLVQTHFPRQLSRVRYDQYLASGWFRGAVMLYKMDLLCLDNELYSVVNIRLNLEKFGFRKGQRKLLRKAESKFKICYGIASTNKEKEAAVVLNGYISLRQQNLLLQITCRRQPFEAKQTL